MLIAMYYGIALKASIPKELTSLNLVVYALFFMAIRRIVHIFTHSDTFWFMHIVDGTISVIIATLMFLAFKRMYSKLRDQQ